MKQRVVFLGTPELAATVLRELVRAEFEVTLAVSQPDRPQGRKRILYPTPVRRTAESLGIPIYQPESAAAPEFADRLRAERPDFLVTAAYGQLLPVAVLEIPRLEAVNVHASLLPRYRGASPVQWSIINGDRQTGVSIMRMVKAMDAGPVFARQAIDILPNETAEELMARLARLGAELLPPTLTAIAQGLQPVDQVEAEATYVGRLSRATGRMDWTLSARRLHDLVRGTYPWPAASTEFQETGVKIYATRIPDDADALREQIKRAAPFPLLPGAVVFSSGGRLIVACGPFEETDNRAVDQADLLEISELQAAGGKRLSAAQCAHNFTPGLRFGAADG